MTSFITKEMQWEQDPELLIDNLIKEYDDTFMPLPDIQHQPHVLISKVRKHYMDYIIKLLAVNYEKNQKLINKNIYLPSAIWRCAKNIEMTAAQTCMVVQIYRKNIIAVIEDLKKDTDKGKMNKKLYDCLHKPPENEKKVQVSLNRSNECVCQCTCSQRKKRRKVSISTKTIIQKDGDISECFEDKQDWNQPKEYNIPVIINSKLEKPQIRHLPVNTKQTFQIQPISDITKEVNNITPGSSVRMSIDTQDSDELLLQLEKLFQGDPNDEDLFEGALYNNIESHINDEKPLNDLSEGLSLIQKRDTLVDTHAAQIKSLDERLASLAGLLVHNIDNASQQKAESPKTNKKHCSSKWLCEEYYLKQHLIQLLDQVRESNRRKLARIKAMLLDLFGDDSDDEGVASPLDETPEFVISCKERVAPWVVKLLTPYYIKGRIKGKALFKALAKHLIRLIYQCSRYPEEYEVHSFVLDFLENHKTIRCEADYKQFRIENI